MVYKSRFSCVPLQLIQRKSLERLPQRQEGTKDQYQKVLDPYFETTHLEKQTPQAHPPQEGRKLRLARKELVEK